MGLKKFVNLEESVALLTKKSDFIDHFSEMREIVHNKLEESENTDRTMAHLFMAACAVVAELKYLSDEELSTNIAKEYIDTLTEAFYEAEDEGTSTIKVVDETN